MELGIDFYCAAVNRLEVIGGCVGDAVQQLVEFEGVHRGSGSSRKAEDGCDRVGR